MKKMLLLMAGLLLFLTGCTGQEEALPVFITTAVHQEFLTDGVVTGTDDDFHTYNEDGLAIYSERHQDGTLFSKRTLEYDAQGNPLALVEYKAPHVTITQGTFDQIVRYNTQFLVPYIIVSNGLNHYCCHIDYTTRTHTFLPEIPTYDDMMR